MITTASGRTRRGAAATLVAASLIATACSTSESDRQSDVQNGASSDSTPVALADSAATAIATGRDRQQVASDGRTVSHVGGVGVGAATGDFVETFDTKASLDRFDFAIHHPVLFGNPIATWQGDHDTDCAAPPTTRTIHIPGNRRVGDDKTYDTEVGETVYWCAPGGPTTGHMMTSINTDGYAQIDFTPKQTFNNVKRICWDQNMTDLGSRKWTQLVVVATDEYHANNRRLDYVSPILDDGPASLATPTRNDTFLLEVHGGSTTVHSKHGYEADFSGYFNADKKRRFTTCVNDLGNGQVQIQLERENTTETRTLTGSFPDGDVKVIFQDDTYNAPKSPPDLDVAHPFTWHWDNILISSSSSARPPGGGSNPSAPTPPPSKPAPSSVVPPTPAPGLYEPAVRIGTTDRSN